MRFFTCAAALLLMVFPACAQGTSGSQGAAGKGGNGVTTSSSSGPEAKMGAKKSPTAGAPTHSSTGKRSSGGTGAGGR